MKKINVLYLLVLVVISAVGLVGCKRTTAVEPVTSEEVSSEVVSEEPSEVISEEPSEEPSEVVSEEVPEIVDGVQMVDLLSSNAFVEYTNELDETVVGVYNFQQTEKGQAILYNDAHYTVPKGFVIGIHSAKTITEVTSTNGDIIIIAPNPGFNRLNWAFSINTTGTDIEVPLNITYEDGTTEVLTVYLTKDWE